MKFRIIVADPPWRLSDKLRMGKTKRSADDQYSTMSIEDIQNLNVKSIALNDSLLALWVPSSILPDGLVTMLKWGFAYKQTVIWVKTKRDDIHAVARHYHTTGEADLHDALITLMGSYFRQTHEVCLIGVRGKMANRRKDKSMRSVFFSPLGEKHSEKPEMLQDMLDKMYPVGRRLEMFARRDRDHWMCVGNECPSTYGEDIENSILRIQKSRASNFITPKRWDEAYVQASKRITEEFLKTGLIKRSGSEADA